MLIVLGNAKLQQLSLFVKRSKQKVEPKEVRFLMLKQSCTLRPQPEQQANYLWNVTE